ncbi:MAG TPA: AMP-binding protein [Ramlibacter sp.]|nr:AMP-binding protein [Ramlibacter sp.]
MKSSPWTEVLPLGDLLIRSAHRHPDRAALVFPQERATFSELHEGALRVARGLLAQGVQPGEQVGLLAANGVAFMQAFFGIALMGAVSVPLNVRHKSSELGYIIANAELAAVLTQSDPQAHVDFASLLCECVPGLSDADGSAPLALPAAPRLRRAILLGGLPRQGFVAAEAFAARASDIPEQDVREHGRRVRLGDAATIIYTSGTTANPKGCMLSHEALTRGPMERATWRLASGDADVHWGAGPLFHIGSLAPCLGALGAGAAYATDLFFEPARALALIRDNRATTIWPWFPAIVLGLLEQPGFDAQHLPDLRNIVLITSPSLAERVLERFPDAEIIQGCGMTETAGIFGLSAPTDTPLERATTQGKVYPGLEVRLLRPDGAGDAAVGEIGEILVRGYCVMKGYYKDLVKTAEALDAQGWLHTGDLYQRDESGNLVFNGRLKDMLKVGGENVAAVELESYLAQHPAVRIAEVVGKPDPRLDEVPVAFVELHEGARLEPQQLIDFCKGRIANFKVPREVHFMQPGEWPMSLTKIDKRGLRSRLAALGG